VAPGPCAVAHSRLGFGEKARHRAKAEARLGLEACAGWASPSSRGLWRGDALLPRNLAEHSVSQAHLKTTTLGGGYLHIGVVERRCGAKYERDVVGVDQLREEKRSIVPSPPNCYRVRARLLSNHQGTFLRAPRFCVRLSWCASAAHAGGSTHAGGGCGIAHLVGAQRDHHLRGCVSGQRAARWSARWRHRTQRASQHSARLMNSPLCLLQWKWEFLSPLGVFLLNVNRLPAP
jgi:hypothetical protein